MMLLPYDCKDSHFSLLAISYVPWLYMKNVIARTLFIGPFLFNPCKSIIGAIFIH